MIEAIQVAAAQANPAASPAAQPQATMFEVSQFADAYANGGSASASASGGPATVAAPAQSSEGMRALMSTFENLNKGADKISAMSH
ncbi:MAG: hypothetical protein L0H23_07895, partial [Luteimonas sp.]|nr:hypothetical protein [Luteimonas sp.]